MAKLSYSEQIKKYEKDLEEIEKKLKVAKSNQRKKERAEDNSRKIRIGGEADKALGRKISKEEIPKFFSFLETQNKRGNFFSAWMDDSKEENPLDHFIQEVEKHSGRPFDSKTDYEKLIALFQHLNEQNDNYFHRWMNR